MAKKYVGFVVLLLGLSYCNALQDELSYLAYALNDLARWLPEAVPGGGDGDGGPKGGDGRIVGESPALPARAVVFTSSSGDVMQRDVVDVGQEDRLLKMSGYVSVYYTLSELCRALKNKNIPMTFDEFRQKAFQTIKAYRIEVACRHYIVKQLMAGLMSAANFETMDFGFGISSQGMREIYHSLISDLASVQAKKYVQVNYDPKKDTLQSTLFKVSGKTLISDIAKIVDDRIDRYIGEAERKNPKIGKGFGTKRAAIAIKLKDQNIFEKVTQIAAGKTWEFTSREVLIELHSKQSFGKAEGFIDLAKVVDLASLMPQGFSLGSDELEYLLWDWSQKNNIGLTQSEIKDNTTIFDSLNLMQVNWTDLLVHLIGMNLQDIYGLLGLKTAQEIKSFFAPREVRDIADFFGKTPREMKYILSMLGKPEYYQEDLQAIAKRSQDTVHVFLVNVAYDYRNPNAAPNWVAITRYPNKQYVVVDVKNEDRTNDINVRLIKRAFGDK